MYNVAIGFLTLKNKWFFAVCVPDSSQEQSQCYEQRAKLDLRFLAPDGYRPTITKKINHFSRIKYVFYNDLEDSDKIF